MVNRGKKGMRSHRSPSFVILRSQSRDICSSSTRQTTQHVTDDNSPVSSAGFCYWNTIQHYVKKRELFQGNLISEGWIFTKLRNPATSLTCHCSHMPSHPRACCSARLMAPSPGPPVCPAVMQPPYQWPGERLIRQQSSRDEPSPQLNSRTPTELSLTSVCSGVAPCEAGAGCHQPALILPGLPEGAPSMGKLSSHGKRISEEVVSFVFSWLLFWAVNPGKKKIHLPADFWSPSWKDLAISLQCCHFPM